MGLFQQLAAPSPFFFVQSKFPYIVKHTGKRRIQYIHGLVLSRNYMRNLYGYSIHCFLHVAKHKTATNSQKTNEKRRRAGIPRRIVSIHQKTGVKQQSSMFCGLFFRCHFLNQHSCQFLPISYSHFNRIIPKSIASCNCNEIAA